MGVRTRGLDIKAGAKRAAADKAARVEAEAVIQRWKDKFTLGQDMLWSPTIRAAHSWTRPASLMPLAPASHRLSIIGKNSLGAWSNRGLCSSTDQSGNRALVHVGGATRNGTRNAQIQPRPSPMARRGDSSINDKCAFHDRDKNFCSRCICLTSITPAGVIVHRGGCDWTSGKIPMRSPRTEPSQSSLAT
jgi:hypothetical protein